MRRSISLLVLAGSLLLLAAGVTGLAASDGKAPKSTPAPRTAPAKKSEPAKGKEARPAPQKPARVIYRIFIDDAITQVTADYVSRSIEKASQENAEALVIVLNTPGGIVVSMESIVQKMLSSEVPIIVYVSPSGAHAASAGVFIVLSANIAAMAPSTRMGAAHPVTGEGEDLGKTMKEKAVNDLTALIRGIAEKRGRNAKWAEEAVRKSVSATEQEALKLKVIDLVASDLPGLLKSIDGRTVEVLLGKKTIRTEGAEVRDIEKGFRHKVLEVIGNPNIAYILLLLGFYGLYFELSNPGAIFPGVVGAILLILGFYALQELPINYAGLLLIILGIGLFIAEAFITSHGILGVGGTIAMLIGSVMLIDSPSPELRISWAVILPAVALSALLFIVTVTVALRVHREKADTGREGLAGLRGEAKTDIRESGQVFVRGEFWNARSDEPILKGDRIEVIAVEGLTLTVKKT